MPISLTHNFYSDIPDTDSPPGAVRPSHWNEEHILQLATNKVIGRAYPGSGDAEELSFGTVAASLAFQKVSEVQILTEALYGGLYLYLHSYYDPWDYADGAPHGGGWFWYDATDTTSADDGATVLVDLSNRRWKRNFGFKPDAAMFGVKGTGVVNDTTAWNRVIAAINAETIKSCYIPAGFNIRVINPDTLITASNWTIYGDGQGSCRFTKAAAGTDATFFKLGDASNQVDNVVLSGFSIYNNNTGSMPTGSWQIEVYNSTRVNLVDLFTQDAPFLRLGNATQNAGQFNLMRVIAAPDKSLGEAAILIEQCSGSILSNLRIGASNDAADPAFRFLKIAPPAGSNVDTITFRDVIANEAQDDHATTVEIDYSYDDVGTLTFDRCNFEQGVTAMHCHNNNGTDGFCTNLLIYNTRLTPRFTTSGSAGLRIENTNPVRFSARVHDSKLSAGNGPAVVITGDATDASLMNVIIESNDILDRRQGLSGSRSAIKIGASGVALKNNTYTSGRIGVAASTVTITNATPAVVSWTGHALSVDDPVTFTTTGALPTGLTAGVEYYVIAAGLTANAFQVSATIGGAAINTSSAGSGTHTASTPTVGFVDRTTFSSGVEFTADVERFTIEGEDFLAITSTPPIDATLITGVGDPAKQIVRNNKYAYPTQAYVGSTALIASPALLRTIPLPDNSVAHIEARVMMMLSDGSQRASYAIAGTFYRDGGSATQQGTTTAMHSAESQAGFNASFSVSGNNVEIYGTTYANSTTRMSCDVDVKYLV